MTVNVTQILEEVLSTEQNVNVTQVLEEVLYTEKNVNVTQILEEVLYIEKYVRVSQVLEEVLYYIPADSKIDRTGKGKGQDNTLSATLTIPAISIAARASLILLLVHDPVTVNTVVWNGIGLTKDVEIAQGTSVQASIWSLRNNSNLSASTITVTFNSAITSKSYAALELSHLTSIPLEKDVTATGSGASGDPSTSSVTPSKATSIAIGAVGFEGPKEDTAGTWQNSYTEGEEDGTTGGAADANVKISHGFKQLSSIASQTVAKTGNTSRPWAAVLSVYVPSAPLITTFSPHFGFPGTVVVLTGEGFGDVTSVTIGGVSAAFTTDSPTQVSTTVPSISSGPISITTNYGSFTTSESFNVTTSLPRVFTHGGSIQTGKLEVAGY